MDSNLYTISPADRVDFQIDEINGLAFGNITMQVLSHQKIGYRL